MDEWTTIYSRRFNRSHPALSNIIEEPVRNVLLLMVDFNPDKRPSAAELLTEQDWIQSGKIPAITNSLIIPYGVPPPPIAPRPKRNSTL